MSVINDTELLKTIVEDIVNNYKIDIHRANNIARGEGAYLVEQMWSAYDNALNDLMSQLEDDEYIDYEPMKLCEEDYEMLSDENKMFGAFLLSKGYSLDDVANIATGRYDG